MTPKRSSRGLPRAMIVAVGAALLVPVARGATVVGKTLKVGVGTDEPLASQVDPPGDVADCQVNDIGTTYARVYDENGNDVTSTIGTNVQWLSKSVFNALSNLYVITFNSTTGSGQYTDPNGIRNIEARWKASEAVTFTDLTGVDHNLGTFTSGGRSAISGTQAYMALGAIGNHYSNGWYWGQTVDPLVPTSQVITYLGYEISPTSATRYVSAVGAVLCAKTSIEAPLVNCPQMSVRFYCPATGSNYLACNFIMGNAQGNQARIFYGVRVLNGCRIYRVVWTGNETSTLQYYGQPAFDDLAFQVVAPPPMGTVLILQ